MFIEQNRLCHVRIGQFPVNENKCVRIMVYMKAAFSEGAVFE